MKPVEWKTYRTRFLVKAKQLNSSLSFIDHLGRQHCGRKGDYLVESSEGILTIAPRQIFEDVYVRMLCDESSEAASQQVSVLDESLALNKPRIDSAVRLSAAATKTQRSTRKSRSIAAPLPSVEALEIEKVKTRTPPQRTPYPIPIIANTTGRESRKGPQSVRATSSRLGLM